jgi:4-carboxymuconolactone decarboxylase
MDGAPRVRPGDVNGSATELMAEREPRSEGIAGSPEARRVRERMLRRIALGDIGLVVGVRDASDDVGSERLDRRSRALARLGALLAAEPAGPPLRQTVDEAQAAGVTSDELVWVLIALIPTIGVARAAAVAPGLALAIGYDVDAALELTGSP